MFFINKLKRYFVLIILLKFAFGKIVSIWLISR